MNRAVILLAVILTAIAEPKQADNLVLPAPVELKEGYYLCYAMDGEAVAYECTVTIRRPKPSCIIAIWSSGYQGVGMHSGNQISIGWRSVRTETVGIVLLSPTDKDGKTWTAKQLFLPSQGEPSLETWEFLCRLKGQGQ